MAPLRILIADGSVEFMAACRRFLSSLPGVRVVATATDGHEVLRRCELDQPDLVLLDAFLDGLDGFQTSLKLKSHSEPPAVVITSLHDFGTYRLLAEAAGADTYIPKTELFVRLPAFFAVLRDSQPGDSASEAGVVAGPAAR